MKYRNEHNIKNDRKGKRNGGFSKNEYGTGSGTHAIFRADNSCVIHNSKEIEI